MTAFLFDELQGYDLSEAEGVRGEFRALKRNPTRWAVGNAPVNPS